VLQALSVWQGTLLYKLQALHGKLHFTPLLFCDSAVPGVVVYIHGKVLMFYRACGNVFLATQQRMTRYQLGSYNREAVIFSIVKQAFT
jgi:hypothetical protein